MRILESEKMGIWKKSFIDNLVIKSFLYMPPLNVRLNLRFKIYSRMCDGKMSKFKLIAIYFTRLSVHLKIKVIKIRFSSILKNLIKVFKKNFVSILNQ